MRVLVLGAGLVDDRVHRVTETGNYSPSDIESNPVDRRAFYEFDGIASAAIELVRMLVNGWRMRERGHHQTHTFRDSSRAHTSFNPFRN